MISPELKEIINQFTFEGELQDCRLHGNGHINKTYAVDTIDANGVAHHYILQRVNNCVFKDVDSLMENFVNVTTFLHNKIMENGGDPERETMNIVKTKAGYNYLRVPDGYYRAFLFVRDTAFFDAVDSSETFKKSGIAFGKFQKLLSDYPAATLNETIPDFHNTKARFQTFLKAVENNLSGRADTCRDEIDFVLQRKAATEKLVGMIDKGELPLRVTHNDTKLNNVLFDKDTLDCVCVIDLDTVMPGLALYDFGDSIRFGANTGAEDEKDLSKVNIDLDYFRAYAEGFLSEAGESLTQTEIDNLAFASMLMTFECGMRFLTDYLDGDTYFGTAYPEHNLVRARDQFKLVQDMEAHMDEMEVIIRETAGK